MAQKLPSFAKETEQDGYHHASRFSIYNADIFLQRTSLCLGNLDIEEKRDTTAPSFEK